MSALWRNRGLTYQSKLSFRVMESNTIPKKINHIRSKEGAKRQKEMRKIKKKLKQEVKKAIKENESLGETRRLRFENRLLKDALVKYQTKMSTAHGKGTTHMKKRNGYRLAKRKVVDFLLNARGIG